MASARCVATRRLSPVTILSRTPAAVSAALVVGLVSFYIAYVVAAVVGLAVLWGHHAADPALIAVAAAFCLVALGIPAVVLWIRRQGAGRLPPRLLHFPASATLLHGLAEAPLEVLRSPAPLAATVLLQLAVFLLDSATLWVMFSAVGQPIPLATAVAGFMMASVAATLAPIPLGLGSFEAAAVGTLGLLDVPLETALTAVLLLRGFTFWLPMLPGMWLVRRALHFGRASPARQDRAET